MTDSQTNLTCLSNDDNNNLSSGNLLSKINSPDDIKKMSIKELEQLASEIRNEINKVEAVTTFHYFILY